MANRLLTSERWRGQTSGPRAQGLPSLQFSQGWAWPCKPALAGTRPPAAGSQGRTAGSQPWEGLYHVLGHRAQGILFPRGLTHTEWYRLKGRGGCQGLGTG